MLAAVAIGALLAGIAGATPGVVQWDIARRQTPTSLEKRAAGTFEEVITNERTRGGYFATCMVGSPPQPVTLQLDTGSSDIWIPSPKAPICGKKTTSGDDMCTLGTFDSSKSSNYTVTGANKFSIGYVDGTFSKGDYFTDAFEIGGAKVVNLTMGLGRDTDIPYGLAGIGYAANVASVVGTQQVANAYSNLPVVMVEDGLIATTAYSLWLNDLSSSSGNVLFGGVDTAKFQGNLTKIKVYKDPNVRNHTSFMVALTSLEASSPSGSDTLTSMEFPIPVVLDTGTTLSYLPNDIVMQVWEEVGAVYSNDVGLAVLPCSMASSKGYFTFGFAGPSGPKIKVPMDELVLDLTNGRPPVFKNGRYQGQNACEFGIQNFSSSPFLLGDSFLRSAYIVYDLENHEIALAATELNATASNVVAFPSFGAPIPSATVAANQDAALQKPAFSMPAFSAAGGFLDSGGARSMRPPAWLGLVVAFGFGTLLL